MKNNNYEFKERMGVLVERIFEDTNINWICKADKREIKEYKTKIKTEINRRIKCFLDKIVKAEKKYDLHISDYITCGGCKSISDEKGNCNCKKNSWLIEKSESDKLNELMKFLEEARATDKQTPKSKETKR